MNKPTQQKSAKVEQATDHGGNSWNDRTSRFEMDALLRSQGFRIEQRRAGKPAVWSRGKRKYTQEQAIALLPCEAARDAALCEAMHEYEWED